MPFLWPRKHETLILGSEPLKTAMTRPKSGFVDNIFFNRMQSKPSVLIRETFAGFKFIEP